MSMKPPCVVTRDVLIAQFAGLALFWICDECVTSRRIEITHHNCTIVFAFEPTDDTPLNGQFGLVYFGHLTRRSISLLSSRPFPRSYLASLVGRMVVLGTIVL